jgi:hypothetical protein
VLEAHPVDTLVNRRDELDARDRSPVEDIERLVEDDLRPFQTPSRFALAWRSSSVRWWTYRSQSATRTARWLSG